MKKISLNILLLAMVSSCSMGQFTNIQSTHSKYSLDIIYDQTVPTLIKQSLDMTLKEDKNNDEEAILSLKNFQMKRTNIYAGNYLRSLETEITSSIEVLIILDDKEINKTLMNTKRFNSMELNALAEMEMNVFVKQEIFNAIVHDILFEVNLLDL